ncbi:Endonuclease/exonuclease/phosphatase [Lipomyces oligophaga]|uniref:Endonuclease/exonuclease/phosphatase n=1 Tax=Lipomyces oligophaga TaxID=45792 RepID=UPI0034CE74F6
MKSVLSACVFGALLASTVSAGPLEKHRKTTSIHKWPSSTSTAAAATFSVPRGEEADTLRFQSWNLRYDSKADGETIAETLASLNATVPNDDEISYYSDYSEVTWSDRRIGVSNLINFNKPDLLCVQEALYRQVTDLAALLPGYKWIGVGRDDGNISGEFEAFFYKENAVSLVDWSTFWLSETPFEPSKYPGAGSYRSATVGHFKSKAGNKFTGICTHWDDQSDTQRQVAASLLRYRGAYETAKTKKPVILFGDFNSQSTGSDSGGYEIITGESDILSINETFAETYNSSLADTFVFKDLLKETAPQFRSGHHATFNGFKAIGATSDFTRIDFQMAGSNSTWEVETYRVEENFFDNEYHLSDHRPVLSDFSVGYKKH